MPDIKDYLLTIKDTSKWMRKSPKEALLAVLVVILVFLLYRNIELSKLYSEKDNAYNIKVQQLDSCNNERVRMKDDRIKELDQIIERYQNQNSTYEKTIKKLDTTLYETHIIVKKVKTDI